MFFILSVQTSGDSTKTGQAHKQPYRDLGDDFFETRDKERVVKGALRRLESLGYIVTLQAYEEVSA